MESLIPAASPTPAIHLVTTDSVDVAELASVAAQTFPLACPATTTVEDITSFVNTNLSPARFAEYLADSQRGVLIAQYGARIVGYAMLVRGVSADADTARAVDIRPAAELSKIYLVPGWHGTGTSTALMQHALTVAADWGVRCVWLGVNQANQRAQRFYLKSGFTISGTRTFRVGQRLENDHVMIREVG